MKQIILSGLLLPVLFFGNTLAAESSPSSRFPGIDLTRISWSICRGIPPDTVLQSSEPGMEKTPGTNIPANSQNCKEVHSFPVLPGKLFQISPGDGIVHFYGIARFSIKPDTMDRFRSPVIRFASIGQNYRIYLNGNLLLDEIHLNSTRDRMLRNRTRDGLEIYLDRRDLQVGENTLLVEWVGLRPGSFLESNPHLGLSLSDGYWITESENLNILDNEVLDNIIHGVYFVFGLLYIFIYIKTRKDSSFLFFGIFTILLSAYLTHTTRGIFYFYDDFGWKIFFEYILVFSLFPSGMLFLGSLANDRFIGIPEKISLGLAAVLFLGLLIPGERFDRSLLIVWQVSAVFQLIYISFLVVYHAYMERGVHIQIALGYGAFFLFVTWDFLDAMVLHTGVRVSRYGFAFMILSFAVILVNRFLNIQIQIDRQKTAFARFFPSELLFLLNKETILDLRLGDQAQFQMAILFSDIRSFTELSESMTPAENFAFINSYFRRMEPIVKNYQGFVDKFIGDSIMALFPGRVDDAVHAVVDMHRELVYYNEERESAGEKPLGVGVGIHFGSLMVGTVGGENRMDGTVISDAVNVCSRIESLTRKFGASILVSGEVFQRSHELSGYHYRFLGRLRVKGKRDGIVIYEIITGTLPGDEEKISSQDLFEEGVYAFLQKNRIRAREIMSSILELNPLDGAARYYLKTLESLPVREDDEEFV